MSPCPMFMFPLRVPLRFGKLRASLVAALHKNPKSKPRHEHVDVALYTVKAETDYMDVYEATLPQ